MSKDKMLKIRCSDSELSSWKDMAAEHEVSVSEFVRGVIEWYCANRDVFVSNPTRTSFMQRRDKHVSPKRG